MTTITQYARREGRRAYSGLLLWRLLFLSGCGRRDHSISANGERVGRSQFPTAILPTHRPVHRSIPQNSNQDQPHPPFSLFTFSPSSHKHSLRTLTPHVCLRPLVCSGRHTRIHRTEGECQCCSRLRRLIRGSIQITRPVGFSDTTSSLPAPRLGGRLLTDLTPASRIPASRILAVP